MDKVIRQIHLLNVLFPRLRSTLKDHMPIRLSAHGSQSTKFFTDFLGVNLEGKAHLVPINVWRKTSYLFLYVCVTRVQMYVCVQVHIYMHIHVCGVPRFVSGVFLDHFPPYILRDCLSLNREDTILVSLQPACSGDPLSPLYQGYRWATTPKRLLSGF